MNASYALFTFQLIAFIILVLLMHDLYRKLRREQARTDAGPDAAQMRAGVDEMVAELRRAADRINADIVARAGTLQKLVDEADQKMRALDAAVTRGDAGRLSGARAPRPSSAPTASAPTRAAPTASLPRVAAQHAAPAPAAQQTAPPARRAPEPARAPDPVTAAALLDLDTPLPGAPAGEPVRTLPRVAPAAGAAGNAYRQAAARASRPAGEPASQPEDDGFVELGLDDAGKFQTVRRLAGEGLSPAEIARRTRMGREEVELIMRLSGEPRQ